MNILEKYKYETEHFSVKNYNSDKLNEAIGTSFEFELNDKIIREQNSFFLYHQVIFKFAKDIKWTVYMDNPFTNNCDNNLNLGFVLPAFNRINIDHIVIKPYAVFVFESKNHGRETLYTPEQLYWKSNGREIINPVYQVLKYAKIITNFLENYNINLPVVPRVVFRQKLDLSNLSTYEQQYCIHISELNQLFRQKEQSYSRQPDKALTLAKAFYYNSCHPVAYDNNESSWR